MWSLITYSFILATNEWVPHSSHEPAWTKAILFLAHNPPFQLWDFFMKSSLFVLCLVATFDFFYLFSFFAIIFSDVIPLSLASSMTSGSPHGNGSENLSNMIYWLEHEEKYFHIFLNSPEPNFFFFFFFQTRKRKKITKQPVDWHSPHTHLSLLSISVLPPFPLGCSCFFLWQLVTFGGRLKARVKSCWETLRGAGSDTINSQKNLFPTLLTFKSLCYIIHPSFFAEMTRKENWNTQYKMTIR